MTPRKAGKTYKVPGNLMFPPGYRICKKKKPSYANKLLGSVLRTPQVRALPPNQRMKRAWDLVKAGRSFRVTTRSATARAAAPTPRRKMSRRRRTFGPKPDPKRRRTSLLSKRVGPAPLMITGAGFYEDEEDETSSEPEEEFELEDEME
jgi:hypothetical protein